MKCAIILTILMLAGCANGKSLTDGLVRVQGAEKISAIENANVKVADKLTDKIEAKLEIKPELESQIGVGNRVEKTMQTIGGNQTVSNDTKLMTEILITYKDLTERYIALLKYIIYGMASTIATLIGLLGWALKFLLQEDSEDDRFMQSQINKGVN